MTIEIKQLVIRASVHTRAAVDGDPAPIPSALGSELELRGDGQFELPDQLVAACVREVLRELRRARER